MIPSPAGCFEVTVTSPGPLTVYVMLVSRPLWEKRQMSAVAVPVASRGSGMGLPPSVQELVAVENAPKAATLRSRFVAGEKMPAVVGSTTTMSLPVALGAEVLSAMTSSEEFGGATTRDTRLEAGPFGF